MRSRSVTSCVVLLCGLLAAQIAVAQDLPIGKGETIGISVYGRPDLSGERRLDGKGQVLVPLLGRIDAAGTSPAELEQAIAEALKSAGLVQQPFVSVDILKRRDVFVDGDVPRPGAYEWRQGMTVRQSLTLAGGTGHAWDATLGTVLQAYAAVEGYAALLVRLRGLEAKESRHMAELEFADYVVAETGTETDALPVALDIGELLPADVAPASDALSAGQRAALRALDITALRARQREAGALRLIRFPAEVREDPDLLALRTTHETLIENRISTDLATLNSLTLELQALRERDRVLERRGELIGETIALLRARLDDILKLQESGLVRTQNVIDLQAALSTAMSSQLEIVVAASDTKIEIERKALEISNFAASRRTSASDALETVRTELALVRSRLDTARRSASIARTFQAGMGPAAAPPALSVIRLRDGAAAELPVAPDDPVLPGDTLVVMMATSDTE